MNPNEEQLEYKRNALKQIESAIGNLKDLEKGELDASSHWKIDEIIKKLNSCHQDLTYHVQASYDHDS